MTKDETERQRQQPSGNCKIAMTTAPNLQSHCLGSNCTGRIGIGRKTMNTRRGKQMTLAAKYERYLRPLNEATHL